MRKKVQRYTAEFRAEAAKLVLEQGLSLREASQRIAIPKGTLSGWVANARGGKPAGVPGARTVSELEVENQRLRKGLAQMRMERDIVKKRRRTLPGNRCNVRAHEGLARPIFDRGHGAGVCGLPQRFSRLVETAPVKAPIGG